MSHRICYCHVAVKFDQKVLNDALGDNQFYDSKYLLLELGGDNNCFIYDYETSRELASRSWSAIAYGSKWEAMRSVVQLSASCEGGGMRLSGSRHTLPETYIRRLRNVVEESHSFQDVPKIAIAISGQLNTKNHPLSEDMQEELNGYLGINYDADGNMIWELSLHDPLHAALFFKAGEEIRGNVSIWNLLHVSGPEYPKQLESKGLK